MSTLTVGTISEKVTDAGVSVDGVTLKDGGATFTSAVGVTGNTTITSGNLVIGTSGNGIDFSATSDASGQTSELLSDYEEGTWTPVYQASSNPTITYNIQSGLYIKVGDLVHIQGRIRTSATSGGSGTLRLGGLPFTNNNTSNALSTLNVGYSAGWSADHFPTSGYINVGVDYVVLTFGFSSDFRDGIGDPVQTGDLTTGTNKNDVIFSGTYRIT